MYPADGEQEHLALLVLGMFLVAVLVAMLFLVLRQLQPHVRQALLFGVLGISAFVAWGMTLHRLSQWIDEWRGDR